MAPTDADDLGYRPLFPVSRDTGIGVVGAGFIVRDCHLVAYRDAGFRVSAITSRSRGRAEEVAAMHGIPRVADSVEELLDCPDVGVIDIAVPPAAQPALIRRIASHPRKVKGILAQKPLAMSLDDAKDVVSACRHAGIPIQVNQNMRYDQSVRALKTLLRRGSLGDPVLATIEMRAIPHWMPWAEGGRSLSTFIMSIHHLDTFRYWLGDPDRVLASSRPDPRTRFHHRDGINLYILEYDNGARAAAWDDVWAGPAREGSAADIGIRWRVEGTRGLATGTIGWPGWPERVPSTLDYSTVDDPGVWKKPRWPEAWFPDAFAGPMAGLLRAIEEGTEPDISGRDNLRTIALCEAVYRGVVEHRITIPKVGTVRDRPEMPSVRESDHDHEHPHD
ncbi:MAG: Gfo/Idh/MocA family oxidoreductase [Isosphaeraceae bacterium]